MANPEYNDVDNLDDDSVMITKQVFSIMVSHQSPVSHLYLLSPVCKSQIQQPIQP